MILNNRQITIREVAVDVGISFGSCQAIFSRITIREVADDVGISFSSCQAIFYRRFRLKLAAAMIVPKL